MKKFISTTLITALCSILFCMSSCVDDDTPGREEQMVKHVITLELPCDISNPKVSNIRAVLTNIQTKKVYTTDHFSFSDELLTDTLTLPAGMYDMKVTGCVEYQMVVKGASGKKQNNNVQELKATVKATREKIDIRPSTTVTSTRVALSVYNASEGFLITEIYFTGSTTPDGYMYTDDQYIKFGNNSDTVMYADGLAFIETFFTSDDMHDYQPNIMDRAMTINTIYVIPGTGRDVPVKPGEEITIALTAEDHTLINPHSIDLSKADFEIYDNVTHPEGDHDVPGVPNLENWYANFEGCFAFHTRGVKSYAIARPMVDKKTYMTKFRYKFSYIFRQGDFVIPMDENEYFMPNEWVVDAVNLSVPASHEWLLTSPRLDKGYTYCGHVDFDETRYTHAVIRKREGHSYVEESAIINNVPGTWMVDQNFGEKGKWIDTNNSTEDFVPNAQPSYFAKKLRRM